MSAQFVDWGALVGMLGLATLLWRLMANQTKDMKDRFDEQNSEMNRRFDKQDGRFDHQDMEMAELRSDVGELQTDMAVVKNDLGHLRDDFRHLRSRCDRMDTNIVQIMRDVGRLEGEQRSSSPKEKVGAGGS